MLADRLLTWAQRYEQVHLRQLYQYGLRGIRDAKTARRIAEILEAHDWFQRVDGGCEIDGIWYREVWDVAVSPVSRTLDALT